MVEALSPLDQILQYPNFKPFSGKKALEILKKIENKEKKTFTHKGDVLKAISSLGLITEADFITIYKLQQIICRKCGACCSKNIPMKVSKFQLKEIAEKQNTSYKKVKREIRAKPNQDGTFNINRNPCPFLDNKLCKVYNVRPSMCKAYPANEILEFMERGGKYPKMCPIADVLLIEIVNRRVDAENIFREEPSIKEARNNNKMRLLSNMPFWERINYINRIDYT
jgi:Fe-S-cluster containining protein